MRVLCLSQNHVTSIGLIALFRWLLAQGCRGFRAPHCRLILRGNRIGSPPAGAQMRSDEEMLATIEHILKTHVALTELDLRDRIILLYFGSLSGSHSKLGMNPAMKARASQSRQTRSTSVDKQGTDMKIFKVHLTTNQREPTRNIPAGVSRSSTASSTKHMSSCFDALPNRFRSISRSCGKSSGNVGIFIPNVIIIC